MATKWITKKNKHDENIHIPIKDRKPFGISREKALIDVEKLREMGKRARLIETNRKHKLYAPYESVIDENGNPITETNKSEVKKTKSKIKNMDNTTKTLYELGLVNDKGKVSLNKNILSDFLFKDENNLYNGVATVQNGKLEFVTVNKSHSAMIKKILPTNLPDGVYQIYYDDIGDQIKMEKIDNLDENKKLIKFPNLSADYSKEGINMNLEGDQLEKLITITRNIKEDSYYSSGRVIFEKEANSDKVKIKFWIPYQILDYKIETKVNDGVSNPLKVVIPAYAIYNTLKMLGKMKDINSISLDLKTEFPMQIHTKQKIEDETPSTYVESYGLIAPFLDE
jgi:hypothetical protein